MLSPLLRSGAALGQGRTRGFLSRGGFAAGGGARGRGAASGSTMAEGLGRRGRKEEASTEESRGLGSCWALETEISGPWGLGERRSPRDEEEIGRSSSEGAAVVRLVLDMISLVLGTEESRGDVLSQPRIRKGDATLYFPLDVGCQKPQGRLQRGLTWGHCRT